jgi:hypothetical protein
MDGDEAVDDVARISPLTSKGNLTMYRTLLGAAVSLVIAMPATAQAQCSYRMNDVGRPHGYLSGPCNGAAQNYAGAYRSRAASTNAVTSRSQSYSDRNGNAIYAGVNYSNGTGVNAAGNRMVRTGNTVRTYDASGRVMFTGHWRGNVFKFYNSNGRLIATANHNSRRMYDARGRYMGTASYSGGPSR